jgi:hypothetical protein
VRKLVDKLTKNGNDNLGNNCLCSELDTNDFSTT